MNIKVSVIIPIYNTAIYIERCAKSLLNQTLGDELELIFVDDGSTDDSVFILRNILQEFPERINQVKIIQHNTNKGSGAARTTGIAAATGEFVGIVDSDDYIDHEMFENLYSKAIQENADVVVSDIIFKYKDHSFVVTEYLNPDDELIFEDVLINERTHTFSCNKLVRRELYLRDECQIPNGLNFLEDRHVMTRIFFYAKKIVKDENAYYHYTQYRPNSITKNKHKMHFENVLLFWKLMDSFLSENHLIENYKNIVDKGKLQNKCDLMIDTNSCKLRKEYASMFLKEEKQYIAEMKRGERIMLFLVRNRLFMLAQLFHNLLKLKNKRF